MAVHRGSDPSWNVRCGTLNSSENTRSYIRGETVGRGVVVDGDSDGVEVGSNVG